MPFVTEEIYQSIPHEDESITISAWPTENKNYQFDTDVEIMSAIQEIIKSVRNMRSEVNTPLSKSIDMMIKTTNKEFENQLVQNKAYLEKFCNTEHLTIASDFDVTEKMMTSVVTNGEILIPMQGLIDIEAEIERLQAELVKLENEVSRCEKMLTNSNFINKAPLEKVEIEKDKLVDYKTKYETIKKRLNEL